MRKDCRTNKLVQGSVTTLPRSVLILDETAIREGKFSQNGVKNL